MNSGGNTGAGSDVETDPHAANLCWHVWMDLFRTAAALIVVISHARDVVMADYDGRIAYAPFYAATGFGHSGVIVFFVLSGFWISRSVLGRLDSATFWRDYAIDRLTRLWIVLLPALLLGGLLDWIGAIKLGLPLYAGTSGSHSVVAAVADRLGSPVLLGNIAFLQTIAVPTWGSNGPLWSLASEFWYYVWFPALMLLVAKRRPTLALAGLVIALINPQIGVGFASWLAGFALLRLSPQANGMRRSIWIMGAAGALFVGVLLMSGLGSHWAIDLALAFAFALFLFTLRMGRFAVPLVLVALARYGRDTSYSLYVIHFPIIALAGSLATRGERIAASPFGVALVVALTALCVAVAWLFSLFTERNTDRVRTYLRGLAA